MLRTKSTKEKAGDAARSKAWAKRNPARRLAAAKKWRDAHPGAQQEAARAYHARLLADPVKIAAYRARQREKKRLDRAAHPERYTGPAVQEARRRAHVWKRYKVTLEEYDALAAAQNGACAICGVVPTASPGSRCGLHLDHCHQTGRVRTLLCMRCNMLVGVAENRPQLWAALTRYVTEQAARLTSATALGDGVAHVPPHVDDPAG